MLISGEVHGDEVIGTHASLAFIQYMAENYHSNKHVRRMIDTRLLTIIPMTNAIGFYHNERKERHSTNPFTAFDPNRDFGFNQNPLKCMQTVAARVINELFRTHIFRLLITLHGGTNVIGYEWGDFSHCTEARTCKDAPDIQIMAALAKRMQTIAGSAGPYEAMYVTGDMGSTVYPVNGGMEDWAYGASWDPAATQCTPSTLGGYSKGKTSLDNFTKRCVTYLVETGSSKRPPENTLGTSQNMMRRDAPGDGHIPRNVRLLFTAVDALEPYADIRGIHEGRGGHTFVSWTIGGSFTVDGTLLMWTSSDGQITGLGQVKAGRASAPLADAKASLFSDHLPAAQIIGNQTIYVRIAFIADGNLTKRSSSRTLLPQSHLAASRSGRRWEFNLGKHSIHGHFVFFSNTLKVERTSIGSIKSSVSSEEVWSSTSQSRHKFGANALCEIMVASTDAKDARVCRNLHGAGELVRGVHVSSLLLILAGVIIAICFVAIVVFVLKRNGVGDKNESGEPYRIAEEEDHEERTSLTKAEV